MGKKIIVTGANGQLGSELRALQEQMDHELLFIDIEELDLTNLDQAKAFFRKEKADIIINAAAYTAVDKAESEPELAERMNAEVPAMLAAVGRETGCLLVHISTDYVFGGEHAEPLKEDHPTGPESIYGKTKLAGEVNALEYPNTIVLRTSWLYSPTGKNFVKSMLRFLAERKEIGVVFDQVGTPTSATDLAMAIVEMIERSDEVTQRGIYHFSNEGVASWYDFAMAIQEFTGTRCRIHPITTKDFPTPAIRPAYAVLDKAKIKEAYGITIPHWRESLKICIDKISTT